MTLDEARDEAIKRALAYVKAAAPWEQRTPEEWLADRFPHVATFGLGERHKRLWAWFEALKPNERPKARIEVWPRGGAKSSSGELGIAYLAEKLTRRFVLYVSGTQDQADLHVQSVAALLESMGQERATDIYGTPKGWRRRQLRTRSGFNVAAYGLDAASRGVKIEQYRPDLIIFDDVDDATDTVLTVQKKENAITGGVIPTGSPDCAVLFLQNLIHEEGVVSRLVDGRAEFLLDRDTPQVEPAVEGLIAQAVETEDGSKRYQIVAGVATWEGQTLETCERQINDWGLQAFLREAQHEVRGAAGHFFDTEKFGYVEMKDVPPLDRVCLAWDLAATEGAGDYTAAVLLGIAGRKLFVLSVKRAQMASEKVRALILHKSNLCKDTFPRYTVRIPQDPGQAGVAQAQQLRLALPGVNLSIKPVTGKKAVRARGWSEQVNLGNVYLVEGKWNHEYVEEHRKFKEDETHEHDDQVDASSDAYNVIVPMGEIRISSRIKAA